MLSYRNFAFVAIAAILLACITYWAKTILDLNNPTIQLRLAKQERIIEHSKNWPKSPDFTVKFTALPNVSSESEKTVSDHPQFDPADDYFGLPRIGAFEDVEAYCTACHSLQIVMQQRASKARWDYMLTWMSEKQGMAKMPEDDRQRILDYLSSNFGP
jgi:hypothetical protein